MTKKKNRPLKSYLNIIIDAVKLSWTVSPKLTIIYYLINTVSGILPAIIIWSGKKIVDSLTGVDGTLQESMFHKSLMFLGIAFGAVVLDNVLSTFKVLVHDRLEGLLKKYVQLELIKKSLELDLIYFESDEFYSHYEKVRLQIEDRLPGTVAAVKELFRIFVELVSVTVILVNINWVLVPVILTVNIPALLWGMKYSRGRHRLSEKHIPELKVVSYLKNITTDKESIKEVKLFNLGDYLINKFIEVFDIVLDVNWKMTKKEYSGNFFTTLFSDAVYYAFYLYTIVQIFFGKLHIGDLVLYTASFSRASGSFRMFLRSIKGLYENALYLDDYNEFLRIEPRVVECENPLELGQVKNIKVDNIWFRYKPDLPWVFEDLSFEVNEKENVAIVGENGSGKTTLIKLLMRFYDVEKGAIYINGENIKRYSLESLWKQFGTIFQDFVKYQMTVRENIAFGQVEKIDDFEEIEKATKKADAEEFILKLPEKYENMLGTRFEGGTDLSLGQWQRIALARAFIRDSSVIILDEPTASLDAKAEYEIFKKFTELTKDKNTFLISHRFSTVRLADRIFVLERGKLLEQGTHEELLEQGGRYAEMFSLQAEGYK
jgi:ABC-type multidrug transport system fused ATPase/permease subunit